MDLGIVSAIVLVQERATEVVKGWLAPLFDRIKNPKQQAAAKVTLSAAIGFGLAFVSGFNVPDAAGVVIETPFVAEAISGLLGAGGAGVLAHVIDLLKARK